MTCGPSTNILFRCSPNSAGVKTKMGENVIIVLFAAKYWCVLGHYVLKSQQLLRQDRNVLEKVP